MIIGRHVFDYMLNNDEIMKWLAVPSRDNLGLMSIAPRIVSPQVTRVGLIQALNLEIYTYGETYVDDDGKQKPFIGDDDVIIGGQSDGDDQELGKEGFAGAGTGYDTFVSPYVPYKFGNKEDQTVALAMFSRAVLAPECVSDWAIIKAKGE